MPNASRIELPRPAIIAVLGVLVLAVTFVVTHGKEAGTTVAPSSSSGSTATNSSTTTTTGSTATTTTTTTAKPSKPQPPALHPGPGLPAGLASAMNHHDVVVLFFYEPAGADDQATRAAIRAVRTAGRGVRLFSDTVARISNYRRVVGSLGISQTPAMVVIDKNRNARLFEGYLDAGTIRQSVTDAR